MLKNIYNYFEDLHKKDLLKNENNFIMDNNRISFIENLKNSGSHRKPILTIDGTPYHSKDMRNKYTLMEFATENLYNEVGIPTIPTYTLDSNGYFMSPYKILSQDVYSIAGLNFKLAKDTLKKLDILEYKLTSKFSWSIFYDKNLQETFLKYITPECLEMLETMFLIDELRTEVDRHDENYFLVNQPSEDKASGILAFDNELAEILITKKAPTTKEAFEAFIKSHSYSSYTPHICFSEYSNYITKLQKFKKLIQDQVLTPKQIETVKHALSYDFPAEILKAGQHPFLQQAAQPVYDAVSQLWEYNRSELGKELGL